MGLLSGIFGKKRKDETFPEFPFPLVETPGKQAPERLRGLLAEAGDTGATPVLLGDASEVARVRELMEYNRELPPPEDIIARAMDADPAGWLAKRYSDEDLLPEEDILGTWPASAHPGTTMRTPRKVLAPVFKKTVYIALIPAPEPWQAPAHLRVGGWNEYPDPVMETAVARMWQERYGARYAACLGDTVEYLVSAPPDSREQAEELAWEHYRYCPDVVDQGAESIRNLASVLLGGTVWFFWWD